MSSHFVPGNRITLLETGQEYFPALMAAIDGAECEICLETYIFEADETGRMIAGRLAAAARRGVLVRLMVDGFGAREFPHTLMPALQEAGVQVQIFRPELARLSFRRHRLRRLHRKLAVIDARLAFVGGINIIDDMHTPHQTPPRYDYAVQVEGPVLADIYRATRRLWGILQWARLGQRFRNTPPPPLACQPVGSMNARFVIRDSLRHRRDIEDSYLEAIDRADSEIVIACAYFLPGWRFRRALLEAARRGVRVQLLLQGRVEYLLLYYASQALYGSLLDGGVRIFEYHKSFLHAKVAVVDAQWATVGSSNIEPFSLLLAKEANLVIRDAGFARTLRASLERATASGATELKPAEWKRQPLWRRAACWSAYGLVRFLIGLAGYRGKVEDK